MNKKLSIIMLLSFVGNIFSADSKAVPALAGAACTVGTIVFNKGSSITREVTDFIAQHKVGACVAGAAVVVGGAYGLYKHKETGKTHEYLNEYFPLNEILDFNYWEEVTYVENVYNRCVIYNAKQFHTATGYFGTTPEDSRLTQVFFFHVLDE